VLSALPAFWSVLSGCDLGCLDPTNADCVVPSPCEDLVFTCEGGVSEVQILAAGQTPPALGPDVLASPGDVVLRNDRVVAVFDALDHPHYVAPAGGSLLDLAPVDGDDALRNVFQATGLLPGDAVHYSEFRILEEGPVKAVQYRGTLDGHPGIHVATRYELRPCEPGVRIRTEVVNLEPDPVLDVPGGRVLLGRAASTSRSRPAPGSSTRASASRPCSTPCSPPRGWPPARTAPPPPTYGVTSCDHATVSGFQSNEFSSAGTPPRLLMPRDTEVYERFVTVAPGNAVSGATDTLFDVGERLGREATATPLSGRLVSESGDVLSDFVQASLVVSDEDGPRHPHDPRPHGRVLGAAAARGTGTRSTSPRTATACSPPTRSSCRARRTWASSRCRGWARSRSTASSTAWETTSWCSSTPRTSPTRR
jgi:hypothetical protein